LRSAAVNALFSAATGRGRGGLAWLLAFFAGCRRNH